ncbi:MAG TPA: hypothetical protein VLF18_20360 [Tahibacter sp.]|uniref:hypothetical protein n=1 Tax=Tahibacter sp. TaxID=2056211 RepID=UPI002B6A1A80|nr:hypothetical protein [Tahibacter sp.]HSX62546.1 hypothetical protein [Tahibacter sp.]
MQRFWLLAALLLFSAGAHAQIGLSPQILDIALDGAPGSQAFRLFNYTADDKVVRVTTVNWTMDADGKVSTIPTTEQSLDGWLVINPLEFTVKAGQNQVVRVAARPAVALTPGEHRAMVYFEEQPQEKTPGAATTLRTVFRFGAAVYGHVGPVDRKGELVSLLARNAAAELTLRNDGNATSRCNGTFAIWRKADFPGDAQTALIPKAGTPEVELPKGVVNAGRLPTDAVLPGATRRVALDYAAKAALPPGEYVLDMNGTFGDTPLDRSQTFRVEAAAAR